MEKTYFDYVLSQWKRIGVQRICEIYKTRDRFVEGALDSFNGCTDITSDWRLLNAISDYLRKHCLISPSRLSPDANEVYVRCKEFFLRMNTLNQSQYDACFDGLADLCWLLASIDLYKENPQGYCDLECDPNKIRKGLKRYLANLYYSAINENNECVYIQEALQNRHKFFYSPQNKEAKKYFSSSEYPCSELEKLWDSYREKSISNMALFYGLTATAALAEGIRMGCC